MKNTLISVALGALTVILILTAFSQLSPLFKSASEQQKSRKAGLISIVQAQKNFGQDYIQHISKAGMAFIASILSYLLFLAHGWRSHQLLPFRICVSLITAVVFCIATYAFLQTEFYIELFNEEEKVKFMTDILWIKLLSVFAALVCGGALFEMLATILFENNTKNA